MAINKELYTQEINATMTILQMCEVMNEYIKKLIDIKEDSTDVTDKLLVIQNQIDAIKLDVQNNTNDITTNKQSIISLNNLITQIDNAIHLHTLIKGSNNVTVDLDPTQTYLVVDLDQDIKDMLTNLDNNVTMLLSDSADNTNDINLLKQPIAPLAIDSTGKLKLNIGSNLSVDNNGNLNAKGGSGTSIDNRCFNNIGFGMGVLTNMMPTFISKPNIPANIYINRWSNYSNGNNGNFVNPYFTLTGTMYIGTNSYYLPQLIDLNDFLHGWHPIENQANQTVTITSAFKGNIYIDDIIVWCIDGVSGTGGSSNISITINGNKYNTVVSGNVQTIIHLGETWKTNNTLIFECETPTTGSEGFKMLMIGDRDPIKY